MFAVVKTNAFGEPVRLPVVYGNFFSMIVCSVLYLLLNPAILQKSLQKYNCSTVIRRRV